MSGHRTALIYGYAPNLLGLCGPKEKLEKRIILDFIAGKKVSKKKVKEIIKNFKSAYSYYQLVAAANNIENPLDEKVVRAYWMGNELLKKVKMKDFKAMTGERFSLRSIPCGSLPHHSFHVLNIGTLAGKLAENLFDFCLIKWGRVVEIKKDKVAVDSCQPLEKGQGKFQLGKPIRKIVIWNKLLLPKLEIGDWVSVHWGNAIERLSKKELENLRKYTEMNLKAYYEK